MARWSAELYLRDPSSCSREDVFDCVASIGIVGFELGHRVISRGLFPRAAVRGLGRRSLWRDLGLGAEMRNWIHGKCIGYGKRSVALWVKGESVKGG